MQEPNATPRKASPTRSLDDAETLRRFVHRLGEGIYVSDTEGTILDANAAFLEVFGVRSVRELGRIRAADLYAEPGRRDEWLALMAETGEAHDFEWELVRPDGERRTVRDTSFAVVDPETGERLYYGILVDISARKRLEEQLREQLTRDALTGSYNRRYLLDLATGREGAAAPESWGCIYIDLDNFKQHNDTHGHASGDAVLVSMARFLMREVRADEPVVRMGGDEFLVLLLGADARATEEVAQRLRQAAARKAPAQFSLGWASREGDEPLEATIDRADQAMISVRVLRRSGDHPRLPDEMERRRRN